VRPASVADGLAELQVRWPTVPIVYAETRPLAEEWTNRYLAAAHAWAEIEQALASRGVPVGNQSAAIETLASLPLDRNPEKSESGDDAASGED
jgi:hypothetical protein